MNEKRKNLPQIIDESDLLNTDFGIGNTNYLVELDKGKIAEVSQERDVKVYKMRRQRGDMEEEFIHFRDSRSKKISVKEERGYLRNFLKKII